MINYYKNKISVELIRQFTGQRVNIYRLTPSGAAFFEGKAQVLHIREYDRLNNLVCCKVAFDGDEKTGFRWLDKRHIIK